MNLYALNATSLNGHDTLFASGSAAIVVAGAGTTASLQKAQGAAAMQVAATGDAVLARKAQGQALLKITVQGWPSATYFASGAATIDLKPSARASLAVLGQGDGALTFGGRYAVPATLPIPAAYADATRRIQAFADMRRVRVLADPPLSVREQRRLTIQPEGRA